MDNNVKYSGDEWKEKFMAAKDVNAKCEVLDKTSNTVFNTLTGDIIIGFFLSEQLGGMP